MKNLKQIKVIHEALNKQKDRILSEIAKINMMIKAKKESIKKILSYQGEYSDEKKFVLSKAVPILNKNLDIFKSKLNDIIISEENEIDKLIKVRAFKIAEAEKIDRKMQVMDGFRDNSEKELAYESERADQGALDDMSSGTYIRKDHD